MQQTIVPGVAMWSVWQAERNFSFNSLFIRSDAPCALLMVANTDARDVGFYPSSHKLLVEETGHMVRDRPVLDYYDGE